MNVRLFPPEPRFQSAAEQVVWRALVEQLPADSVLFHGVRFSDRRQDREADIIVAIADVGLTILEVKGGQISLDGGLWTQLGRGMVRRIDPVGQARACKYLLRSYLNRHPCWPHGNLRSVHMVAFPFTTVPENFSAPDCPRWMVVGREDLDHVGPSVLNAMALAKDQPAPPPKEQIEDLIDCLAGRMLSADDALPQTRHQDAAVELLTPHQSQILDLVQHLNRVEIRGGPGTGKTWLALEKSRRLAREGKRVGLICRHHGLATLLRQRVATFPKHERPHYVGSLHQMVTDWWNIDGDTAFGEPKDGERWAQQLAERIAQSPSARPIADRFDALVVDEAQDFTEPWWRALLTVLRQPKTGDLFAFTDEGQHRYTRNEKPPLGLVPLALSENLRHTPQITRALRCLAPHQMKPRTSEGVPVRFVPSETGNVLARADQVAADLLREGHPPHRVALLTTGERHPEHRRRSRLGHEEYWRAFWEDDVLFHSHVTAFAGLERPAVVLAVNGFNVPERATELLYIGFSRARDLLTIVGDPELLAEVGGHELLTYLELTDTAGPVP
jgi:hypothetical protein